MKNKRREHGKLIEKFQEKSQQDEVIRHDLIDTMEVSGIEILSLIWNSLHLTFLIEIMWISIEPFAKVNRHRNQFDFLESGIGAQAKHRSVVR